MKLSREDYKAIYAIAEKAWDVDVDTGIYGLLFDGILEHRLKKELTRLDAGISFIDDENSIINLQVQGNLDLEFSGYTDLNLEEIIINDVMERGEEQAKLVRARLIEMVRIIDEDIDWETEI